ncbi:MAG: acyl-CoA dehydrogenase family protein [Eubacteriales bacterium]|nr:acyl-CoA dehydrogenase family protein [Eubacteriales bacterium]MDY3332756.1 acyl-CoA dehydrogenase family protein [Gallibacter sp.]
MELKLSIEQEILKRTVSKFAAEQLRPIASEVDEEHQFPYESLETMKKMGLMGLPFDCAIGGSGADYLSFAVVVEELAKECATTASIYATHIVRCCYPIVKYGTDKQKESLLRKLFSGEYLGAFGMTEPNAGTDFKSQLTTATLDGDSWVLNGAKFFVTNAGFADVYIIIAITDKEKLIKGGISAFIVKNTDEGFSIGTSENKIGRCGCPTAEIVLQNCRIPKNRLLGNLGDGANIAKDIAEFGRIAVAAQAVGIAQKAFDMTVSYMKERKQFGKKISQFQALQFEIAEIITNIEAARLLMYKAAYLKDVGRHYSREASMAKLFGAKTAVSTTNAAVRLHGGYGYMKDYHVERLMRDAKLTEIDEGSLELQKMIISTSVIGK